MKMRAIVEIKEVEETVKRIASGTTPAFGFKNLYEMSDKERSELKHMLLDLMSDLVEAKVISDDNGVILGTELTKRLR